MIYVITMLLCTLFLFCMARRSARESAEEEQAAAQLLRMQKEQREQERRQQMEAEEKRAAQAARNAAQAARKAAQEQKRQEQARRAEAAHALKVARAAELAELTERRLKMEREIAALRATPDNHSAKEQEQTATPDNHSIEDAAPALQPFKGHNVAFTGRLTVSGMTRAQAIERVQQAGGKAYKTMPACTTLLVVGDKPGMDKLDKADEWISHVRKITERQFLEMLESA